MGKKACKCSAGLVLFLEHVGPGARASVSIVLCMFRSGSGASGSESRFADHPRPWGLAWPRKYAAKGDANGLCVCRK